MASYREKRYTDRSLERNVGECQCVCVSSHTATGWLRYSVHPRASPRVTCKGFENGRRSYELVLEDNYDGDPKTTIYYVVTRGSG